MSATITTQVLEKLRAGSTVPRIARELNISEVFLRTMLDHFGRLGLMGEAQSLCASGNGACAPNGATTPESKIVCAGCAFARLR